MHISPGASWDSVWLRLRLKNRHWPDAPALSLHMKRDRQMHNTYIQQSLNSLQCKVLRVMKHPGTRMQMCCYSLTTH